MASNLVENIESKLCEEYEDESIRVLLTRSTDDEIDFIVTSRYFDETTDIVELCREYGSAIKDFLRRNNIMTNKKINCLGYSEEDVYR